MRKWGRFYFQNKCIIFKNRNVPIYFRPHNYPQDKPA